MANGKNQDDRVRLSVGTWLAIVGFLAAQTAGAFTFVLARESRLVAVETRLDAIDRTVLTMRDDIRSIRTSQYESARDKK